MHPVKKLILALGVLGAADTAILAANSSGVNLGTIMPGAVGVALALWALVQPRAGLDFSFLREWGLRTFLFVLVCCGVLSFLVVQCLILRQAFAGPGPETDWCILLGAGVRGEQPTPILRNRIASAAAYLKRHPNVRVVVSGGQGPGESTTEAEVMRRALVADGIAPARIHLEEKATSTVENLRFSRDVISKAGGNSAGDIGIISSDFHLFRVRLLAQRLGMHVHMLSSPTPWYLVPNMCFREYFALIKSAILDR